MRQPSEKAKRGKKGTPRILIKIMLNLKYHHPPSEENNISNAVLCNCLTKLLFIEENSMRSCGPKCILRHQSWWFHPSNSVYRAMKEGNR
jgi:hypothetical protein